ncbi:MAG TPA: hypothetical protein VJY62_16235, partial [Bacteroidia bacterium]|nr:hypothetical protein [Bacteroidia bacterium]
METQNKFYETIKLIDKILESEFEEGNYRKIIELIKQDFSIQEYFFKTLNNPNWFLPLYSDGFFTPNSIPPPIEEKGVYIYPYWYSLTYLKSVAAHSEHKDYDEIADGLIKVITYVSLKLQQSSDNYRIGFGLLEILLNIPNQFIPIEVLSFISNWINNDYRFTPFDSDLCEKLLPKFLKENLPKNDYLKGEEIFKHIFTVIPEKILEDSNIIFLSSKHFKSVIDLYYIEDAFIRKKLTQKIGEYCSLVPIFHLSDEIKTIFD